MLLAIIAGGIVGIIDPATDVALKPLGDGFIKLMRVVVGPLVSCTIVLGIAHMRDLPRAGWVGLKSLGYFELLSTIALILGIVVANVLRPGQGLPRRREPPRRRRRRRVRDGRHGPVGRRCPAEHHPGDAPPRAHFR